MFFNIFYPQGRTLLYLVVINPNAANFLFYKVFNVQRLFSLNFSAFAVFSKCSRLFSHFNFFKFFQSLATLASTIKYFTRFDRKGEGHARVSHPIIYFTLLCSAAIRCTPNIYNFSGLKSSSLQNSSSLCWTTFLTDSQNSNKLDLW